MKRKSQQGRRGEWSDEEKIATVRRYLRKEERRSDICKRLSVNDSTLHSWIKKFRVLAELEPIEGTATASSPPATAPPAAPTPNLPATIGETLFIGKGSRLPEPLKEALKARLIAIPYPRRGQLKELAVALRIPPTSVAYYRKQWLEDGTIPTNTTSASLQAVMPDGVNTPAAASEFIVNMDKIERMIMASVPMPNGGLRELDSIELETLRLRKKMKGLL